MVPQMRCGVLCCSTGSGRGKMASVVFLRLDCRSFPGPFDRTRAELPLGLDCPPLRGRNDSLPSTAVLWPSHVAPENRGHDPRGNCCAMHCGMPERPPCLKSLGFDCVCEVRPKRLA